jgi:hypothetical protein
VGALSEAEELVLRRSLRGKCGPRRANLSQALAPPPPPSPSTWCAQCERGPKTGIASALTVTGSVPAGNEALVEVSVMHWGVRSLRVSADRLTPFPSPPQPHPPLPISFRTRVAGVVGAVGVTVRPAICAARGCSSLRHEGVGPLLSGPAGPAKPEREVPRPLGAGLAGRPPARLGADGRLGPSGPGPGVVPRPPTRMCSVSESATTLLRRCTKAQQQTQATINPDFLFWLLYKHHISIFYRIIGLIDLFFCAFCKMMAIFDK